MKLSRIILCNSLPVVKMQSLARMLSARLMSGDVITLTGDVGAGKTTFARELIQVLAPSVQEVTSPTFNLMQSYDIHLPSGKKEMLWHLDLYRLKHKEEIEELGLNELWSHVVLIEWPEMIESQLPHQRLDVSFDFGKNEDTRTLVFSGDDAWKKRLRDIQ